jgi:alkylhydroperoxidase family enzyme
MSNLTIKGLPAGQWKLLGEPRVPPAARRQLPILARITLWLIRRSEHISYDLNVFTTLARLGGIFPAHTIFLVQLLRRGRLSPAEKEKVILRIAWHLGAVYEYGHHVHMAKQHGVTQAEIDAIASTSVNDHEPRLAALLSATDELIADHAISEDTWATAERVLSGDELLELCILVGHYVMVSMTLNSTGIQLEQPFADELADRTRSPHQSRPTSTDPRINP